MPELPEVYNTVLGLQQHVIGVKIESVWTSYKSDKYAGKKDIKDPKYFRYFTKQVVGSTVTKVYRRAKHIFIRLNSGAVIAVHMKMTGHFLVGNWQWHKQRKRYEPERGFWGSSWTESLEEVQRTIPLSDPYNNHIRLLFNCEGGRQLAFSDMRKFATITLLEDQAAQNKIENQYGYEPLDKNTTSEMFIKALSQRPNSAIKTALLDQSLVAGFGNIYTDEALFAAKIHPESLVVDIPSKQMELLFSKGQAVLNQAIKTGGDSTGDYRKVDGTSGTFHGMHHVYRREGQACTRCSGIVEKKQIGPRVGRFCTGCQVRY